MLSILRKGFWLFGIAILILIIFLPGYTKLQELRDKNRDLTTRIRRLYIENKLLEEELKRIDNDPTYREKIIREKMGVVRKDEVPIKFIPEKE